MNSEYIQYRTHLLVARLRRLALKKRKFAFINAYMDSDVKTSTDPCNNILTI